MKKTFNVTGACIPDRHYMINLEPRLKEIREMVDEGAYFTINRARQYGKTTTLRALANFLKEDYEVISLDFQSLSALSFETEQSFVAAFAEELLFVVGNFPEGVGEKLNAFVEGTSRINSLQSLFKVFYLWCAKSKKSIVLLIDEVDTASNNQVFLDFLAQLRAAYLNRDIMQTFQSVVLAGVYDVKNLKRKFVSDEQHRINSPWNIAADYKVDMSFSVTDIMGMLQEYEKDHGTGMDVKALAECIYDYTSGYPYLVSRICKLIDEHISGTGNFPYAGSAWSSEGVVEAVSRILSEKNMLFESLQDKVESYPELRELLYALLMSGKEISYNPDSEPIDIAMMFGFIKVVDNKAVVANRIFETRLYNMFLTSPEMQSSKMFVLGDRDKYQFVRDGILDMELILARFIVSFDDLYGDQPKHFLEDDGRRYFLLYLRPIINGTGNYYIESRTRNQERTDVIIDYCGKQYVVEMKIWHGNAYNERGEDQLRKYLDYYHLETGYMLSFNFNKNKKIGVTRIPVGDKMLIEAVV